MLAHARSPVRGSVLLVCLGVLMVLAIFAVAFSRLMTVEQGASQIYVVHTQARFVAEAGIAAGVERLRKDYTTVLIDSGTYDWTYGDTADTPVEYATMPSYGKDGGGNWQTITVAGRVYGYSGTVTNPAPLNLAPNGAHYVLKITDLSGRININDRIAGSAADDARMATFINNLGRGIAQYAVKPNPVNGRGAQIITYRNGLPGGQFKSLSDLYRMPGFTKAEIDLLSQYVTVHGWKETVVIPAPQSNMSNINLNFQMTQRTPVNINTAPEPVLFALFRGVNATCLFPAGSTYTLSTSTPISDNATNHLVDRIRKRKKKGTPEPIRSMYDLAEILDKHLHPPLRGYMPVLMANLNPNTHLTKFNSDWSYNIYGLKFGGKDDDDEDELPSATFPICDKTDLVYYTTEVGFASTGYFEVTSLGRIVPFSRMEIGASYKITQTMRLFEVARHTSQRDFEQNWSGSMFRCRTYPENMPDQGMPINPARGSAIDGQVVLDDRETNKPGPGTGWYSDFDSRLHHRSTLRAPAPAELLTYMRWTSGVRQFAWPANQRNPDVRHNRPVYSSEGSPFSQQNPYDRGVLNEFLPAANRTLPFSSDLHPDGLWYNQYNDYPSAQWRDQIYDAVDGDLSTTTGRAIFYPVAGTADFWLKPDIRWKTSSGAVRAIFAAMTFDSNAQVPFSGSTNWNGPYHAWSELDIGRDGNTWYFYQGQGTAVWSSSIHALCRKPTNWTYSGSAYRWRDYEVWPAMPNVNNYLSPFEWNHVRVQWFYSHGNAWWFWHQARVYVNGTLVWETPAAQRWQLYLWVFGLWYGSEGSNMTGYISAGYSHQPSGWTPWLRRTTGTLEQVRIFPGVWLANTPNHYDPTNSWSYWRGRFTLPANSRILSIRYTAYPGRPSDVNRQVSSTRLEWAVGAFTGGTSNFAQEQSNKIPPASVVDKVGSQLTYTFRFYDSPNQGGSVQTPFTQSPFVDDVTVYYATTVQIVDRIEGM
ncbi:MAG: hypothetical protein HY720_10850 [Planctomycetes bacterium]|nr:hypothetical protein [Planctomycetota bacterium]